MERVWEAYGLTEEEYRKILKTLKREPNHVELGVLGALWSEHCSYKSSKKHLKKFPTKAEWVVQGPGENAGVVKIDEKVWVAFKVESHNHPSYIEPFHGAATGVGGIIRDVLSMGARPIALADSLRFGEFNYHETKRLVKGVVSGISFYGNCIGVPTVAGETVFEPSYKTNPLVNAFCLGVIPAGRMYRARATREGQLLFLIGSSTGRDGIFGAVMASGEFSEDVEEKRPNVQIGDPYFGKKLVEAIMEIVEKDLIVGMQDLGAAGLAGSASEIAAKSEKGVELYLENVPLREKDMNPYEILLSESQERMLLVVEEENVEKVKEIANKWHLEGAVVGKITDDDTFRAYYKGELVAELPVSLIVDEAPVYDRPYKEPEYMKEVRNFNQEELPQTDVKEALKKLLSSPNISCKEWVYTQYDYQVGTNTLLIPGHDAAVLRLKWVLRPELTTEKGIAISSEGNGRMVYLNPYEGGKFVVAEVCRNLACVGAKPLAITDCLNFGNPERPEIMWQFVKAVEGMAEACEELGIPVVSGNVSLYNETVEKNEIRNVFPTPIVVGVGVLEKAEKYTPSKVEKESELYLVGNLEENLRLDGSEYLKVIHGLIKGDVPPVDLEKEKILINLLISFNNKELITCAHDVSVGGLLIALLEMVFRTPYGLEVEVYTDERPDVFFFSENPTRVIIGVESDKAEEVKNAVEKAGLEWMYIGKTTEEKKIKVTFNGDTLLEDELEEYEKLWRTSLEKLLGST
ncbi:phosphoribosylformylglycinamidine synthase subunit PurL [Aquifex aeolicus]|uniref:Phosphoribosylformylglycinamidine synthase subunit PurL n=1 Tax=Aquifex aeolicus (strain VF5) TaxID=224324 RepID=PURL_AQUAE|nr:phosphoribosylformylglycinamidine synthase subunit PurL [Aquifex aeolicus]O67691.1 RecName: Full=Phosphoribosylformylglycinamidine synthase subunit PurL; Short=FGAM synthase; AltName: Full=Formylglycinamide ribonucleotide amidotransferase subunit II; Short=FGAR amidotransferase II; Short=FGAR-AT II; AltName: Full=Glutamine amidotransferase PurL; AltName: Full=Phosphoribosylformylglycinamidine synthase subunit II [Aquifex aeolicus VF5]AAC07653.1 phosphoribosylformylglycinamidine synthase II [Aq